MQQGKPTDAELAAAMQRYIDGGASRATASRQLGLEPAEGKRILDDANGISPGSKRPHTTPDFRPPPPLTAMARKSLHRWAVVHAQRDETIRSAAAAGVGVNEIARITGIAKTTVMRILKH